MTIIVVYNCKLIGYTQWKHSEEKVKTSFKKDRQDTLLIQNEETDVDVHTIIQKSENLKSLYDSL